MLSEETHLFENNKLISIAVRQYKQCMDQFGECERQNSHRE